ncbi:hypothetical protein [Yersinia ruckeri]|uniref:PilN family type IV pilus biogenesis protein n=2 Tax=Yersinia ruckeri TaxID=29486 RepID=A0A0A8V7N9_YERRU|nr:hypothetical protein [Yersinia ruckeri]EKN4184019.1 hypothetical protein [Yersinia ruckeri]KGA44904.1 bacterial type II and III secretion system family protein [Yersinia ruckeri ATCC 29473]MCK8596316.1 type II and III secretion system protein [Yersinia ruckeri]MCW6611980.1 type II and III secretion system protein [Yersinia ruckeri]MCW6618569.1 type II and III secretion system protein [Yersinia ruckeri]
MKRQFFRCVLTTLLSLPLVATAQTSLSLPNNGKNEMDRQVAIHTQILRVEAPSNNKKIDWSAVVKSPFTDTPADEFSGVAIVDEKPGAKGFISALSTQATVSVITQSTTLTTNQAVAPFQYQQESGSNNEGVNMTVLPLLMPSSSKMQLQLSLSGYDTQIQPFSSGGNTVELTKTHLKTFTQRVNIQSGQTLVLSGMSSNQGERHKTLILITPVILE